MKFARLAVIAVALVAALGAGILALNLSQPAPVEPVIITAEPAEPPIKLVDVLATTTDLSMGTPVEGALAWQKWPEDGVGPTLILKRDRPEAIEELKDSIARQSFFAGEPVREAKLIRTEQGFMSAILPAGKRALAIQIAAETSAGGFVLPNDHVDVIMTRRKPSTDGRPDQFVTETVLHNLRVLAIDQTIEEQDGQKVVVGSTATLEVDPEQAEALTAAQQMADRLVLSLRSLADSLPGSPGYAAFLLAQENATNGRIKVIRYGQSSDITTNK